MDKTRQRLDDIAKRMFGATATVDGSFGTVAQPGELRIIIDGKPIGAGSTFARAVQQAQENLAYRVEENKPQPLAAG